MKKSLIALMVLAAGALALAACWVLSAPAVPHIALTAHNPDLANGRTMFLIGGCSSCHAVPKQEDATRLGGGLALPTAFGTFYVPNISSDTKDGIGRWNEAQFIAAMRYGVSPSGQHLYPAFPYTSYQAMRTEDLRDLFAYLKTLPADFRRRARPRSEIPLQRPTHGRPVEAAVSRRCPVQARRRAIRRSGTEAPIW